MTLFLTLRVALKALARNKLRTGLTMLGIIIGVAAVVAMLSIGAGAQASVTQSLSELGVNTLEIYPGFRRGRSRGTTGAERSLVVADWKAVRRLPEVQLSFPEISTSAELVYGSSNWNSGVRGTSPEYFQVMNWPAAVGRVFTESESNGGALVAVLGHKAARELFGGVNPVGETVRIKGAPFRVIGVLKEKGGGAWSNQDDTVIIPYLCAITRLTGRDSLNSITLQASSAEDVQKLQKVAVDFLNERYHITNAEDGFYVYNQAETAAVLGDSTKIFSMLLGGVASVSLLVGGIGIMNIMLVSVTERVREIGIRMAVGARGRDILAQFLTEAVAISLAGGAIGILFGASVAAWVAKLAEWPFIVSQGAVVLAFGTSALIGIFFGFYPAFKASELDPIQALRK